MIRNHYLIFLKEKILTKNISSNLLGEHNVQNLAVISIIDDLGYKVKSPIYLILKELKEG